MDDIPITCPICGGKTWKLFKYEYPNGKCGLRVACCTPGCQVDNVATFESNVKTVWQLIEDEK